MLAVVDIITPSYLLGAADALGGCLFEKVAVIDVRINESEIEIGTLPSGGNFIY